MQELARIALAGVVTESRAGVPFREVGHHIGTPENVELDQVGWIQFQASDVDARVL